MFLFFFSSAARPASPAPFFFFFLLLTASYRPCGFWVLFHNYLIFSSLYLKVLDFAWNSSPWGTPGVPSGAIRVRYTVGASGHGGALGTWGVLPGYPGGTPRYPGVPRDTPGYPGVPRGGPVWPGCCAHAHALAMLWRGRIGAKGSKGRHTVPKLSLARKLIASGPWRLSHTHRDLN